MPVKILASADLHLGRRSAFLPENTPESNTRFVWNRLVERAVAESVDLVLLAGDVVDQDNRYYEAVGPLEEGFNKLRRAGIEVYMVSGNHDFDVLPQLIKRDPSGYVRQLGLNGTWEARVFTKGGESVQICGWSFPGRYFHSDPLAGIQDAAIDPGIPSIGLVHGDAYSPKSPYAPLETARLSDSGVQAWILGHIHKPDTLKEQAPLILYPGSPQAMSSKEPGIHGAVLLTVEPSGNIDFEWIALSPVRYQTAQIDLTGADTEEAVRSVLTSTLIEESDALLPELDNTAYLIWDVVLRGEHPDIHRAVQWAAGLKTDFTHHLESGTRMTVRKIKNALDPVIDNLEDLSEEPSPAGQLAAAILALEKGEPDAFVDNLRERWKQEHARQFDTEIHQILRQDDNDPDSQAEQEADHYLKQECKRLLSSLMSQRPGNQHRK